MSWPTVESGAWEILLILDTCYSGGAATNVLKTLWDTLDERTQSDGGVFVLAVARASEAALDEGGLAQEVLIVCCASVHRPRGLVGDPARRVRAG
jgi:hypothetical protein